MKRLVTLMLAGLAPALAYAQPAPRVIADIGLVNSECVRYDAKADRYIVSNLNQRGADADGYLTRVRPDGTVEALKWIDGAKDGLADPLGLFIAGETIYVADASSVHLYDRASGRPIRTIQIPGALRLNDLSVAPDGTLYVTDVGGQDQPGAIYRVGRSGEPTLWVARGAEAGNPNGVAVMPDGTIVHGGRAPTLTFRDSSGKVVRERTLPTGRIDGIIPLADGSLLVASQDGHVVYKVGAGDGPITTVATGIEVPAAIGYDRRRRRLVVPQIRPGSLTFVDLAR